MSTWKLNTGLLTAGKQQIKHSVNKSNTQSTSQTFSQQVKLSVNKSNFQFTSQTFSHLSQHSGELSSSYQKATEREVKKIFKISETERMIWQHLISLTGGLQLMAQTLMSCYISQSVFTVQYSTTCTPWRHDAISMKTRPTVLYISPKLYQKQLFALYFWCSNWIHIWIFLRSCLTIWTKNLRTLLNIPKCLW